MYNNTKYYSLSKQIFWSEAEVNHTLIFDRYYAIIEWSERLHFISQ